MKRAQGFILLMTLGLILGYSSTPARADVQLDFTDKINFTYTGGTGNLSDLTATVTLSVSGSTLTIVVDNESSTAKIAGVFFNAPNAGTFSNVQAVSSPIQNPLITADATATQQADGFGKFGYELTFGNGNGGWLNTNTIATITATFSGTIVDADMTTLSTGGASLGHQVGVLDWKPLVGLTGFGAGHVDGKPPTPNGVPEPSTMLIAAVGAIGFLGYGLRRRRKS